MEKRKRKRKAGKKDERREIAEKLRSLGRREGKEEKGKKDRRGKGQRKVGKKDKRMEIEKNKEM